MENLNAEQIIKALECCRYDGDVTKSQVEVCLPCPYFNEGNCTDVLKENALALIKELIVELEAMRTAANSYKMHNENLTEENEKLEAMVAMWKSAAYCDKDRLSSIKADTIHKLKRDLYVEFFYLARCQHDGKTNMTSQEAFDAVDRVAKRHLDVSGSDNRCVSCGKIIPEGRQVCPLCECKQSDERR